MMPQSLSMLVATLEGDREGTLRASLASMDVRPGVARTRKNNLVPFSRFDRLHFARFVSLDNLTEVRYKAYPGVSSVDRQRNARIRQGLEKSGMTATPLPAAQPQWGWLIRLDHKHAQEGRK